MIITYLPPCRREVRIVEIILLITSIVSLCSALVGLSTAFVTYRKIIIEKKEKNLQPTATDEDSK